MRTDPESQSLANQPAPPQSPYLLRDFYMGEWHVQPSLGRLTRHGADLRLRPQLMDVLCCLAARSGQVVGRDKIFSTVWPEHFVADTGLARCIAELRQVFGDDAREPTVIETIPKRGYRLLLPVVWPDDSREAVDTPNARPTLASAEVGENGCPPDDAHRSPKGDEFVVGPGTGDGGAVSGTAHSAGLVTDQPRPASLASAGTAVDEPTVSWWPRAAGLVRHSRSWRRWVEWMAGAAVIAAAVGTLDVLRTSTAPALTDRDTVVLAFDNTFSGTSRTT